MIKRFLFLMGTVRQMALLFVFPAALQKRKIELKSEPFIEIDTSQKGLPLVLSFAGLGDHFEFRKTLSPYSVNVIYLRDFSHQWYLNELIGIGDGVNETSRFLKNQIEFLMPSKVIAIGVSAGGFGAMLYGAILDVDVICVFSPQSFRNKLLCLLNWDYRWLDRVVDIYERKNLQSQFLDLKTLMKKYKGLLKIHYDETNRLDNLHGKRISSSQAKHFKYRTGGHNLVQELKISGALQTIIGELLG